MAEKQHSAHQPSGTVHARNCLVQGAVDEGKQLKKYVWGPPWVSSANYPRHGMLTYCLYHMVTWVIFSLFWEKFFLLFLLLDCTGLSHFTSRCISKTVWKMAPLVYWQDLAFCEARSKASMYSWRNDRRLKCFYTILILWARFTNSLHHSTVRITKETQWRKIGDIIFATNITAYLW